MFSKNRYKTAGIANTIPAYIQNILWYMIETMKTDEQDYLQVFELTPFIDGAIKKQKIKHIQECPEYQNEIYLEQDCLLTARIYVIDDIDYCTMLLAEEY